MEKVSGVLAMTMLDCSPSSHADNCKNRFLLLGVGDPFGINGSFGVPEKKFSINFCKAKRRFSLSLHYNGHDSYLFVNGKEIYKFKADDKNVNFPTQFCISNKLNYVESENVSFKRNVYDFSVDYNALISLTF